MKKTTKLAAAALLVAIVLPAGSLAQEAPALAATAVCPAIGADTDCGVVITIDGAGAHLAATGQGPYDGNDDTLVGVVNKGKRPIHALILSSALNIFGFDGDGIDTFGAPSNSQDTYGYGGPNAYYGGINAAATSGTVNFVTPIPVGGTAYFGLENSVVNGISCQDAINGSVKQTASGPSISATFTPNQGLSLQQAEQLCGFTNFDWVQQMTSVSDPSPYIANNIGGAVDPHVTGEVRLTSRYTPFSDPPPGGGYTPAGGGWDTAGTDFSYPFYYNVTTELPRVQQGGLTMTFRDRPLNPCLRGGASVRTKACAFSEAPAGGHESFVTHLAGVKSDGSADDLGIGFTWNSNYNGSTGQVNAKGLAATAADGGTGTGTGGVTITSVQPDTTYQYDGLTVTGLNGSTVGPAGSMLVYSGAPALANHARATISAQLSAIDATPIKGRPVTLTLGSGRRAQSCTATSDATGAASCKVFVDQSLGPVGVTASYAGDKSFLASSTSDSVVVFAYTTGGTFVVGDTSAGDLLPGPSVTFWSPQWAQENQLTGGPGPRDFQGFERTVAPPDCLRAGPWEAGPSDGGSHGPPTYVPAYTAVIVASSVTTQGHVISGNTADIVIVAANPGDGANPGAAGSGTIVAALC